jgi:hypothetical protein
MYSTALSLSGVDTRNHTTLKQHDGSTITTQVRGHDIRLTHKSLVGLEKICELINFCKGFGDYGYGLGHRSAITTHLLHNDRLLLTWLKCTKESTRNAFQIPRAGYSLNFAVFESFNAESRALPLDISGRKTYRHQMDLGDSLEEKYRTSEAVQQSLKDVILHSDGGFTIEYISHSRNLRQTFDKDLQPDEIIKIQK